MKLTRRQFLQAAAAASASGAITHGELTRVAEALTSSDAPSVIWLQGAGCDGCAISLLNSIHLASVDQLLTQTISLEFQSNLMAAAGDLAITAADAAAAQPGYVLVVEGAIPVLHPTAQSGTESDRPAHHA